MEEKISVEKCRSLIEKDHLYSDYQIGQIRDAMYAFCTLVVNKVTEIKLAFTKRFQTVSCRGYIVK